MLDNMIVGTAMPTIVGELGGLEHLSWVVTAYTLATAASTPIWGKLGDMYGRKGVFMASIVIFLIGSALCGMAQDMAELIGFRGVQGLGAGGLMVGVMAIIGDLIPPRERGKYQGMMAGVMPVAMIGGPLVGGSITDHLGWRWAFYINLPLGVVALVVVIADAAPAEDAGPRAVHRLVGAALLTVGIGADPAGHHLGRHPVRLGLRQIIGLAVIGVLALAALRASSSAGSPSRSCRCTCSAAATSSLGPSSASSSASRCSAAMTFLPLFQQSVQGASATNSGLLLLPMMGGMLVISLVAGQVTTRPASTGFPVAGSRADDRRPRAAVHDGRRPPASSSRRSTWSCSAPGWAA